MTKKVGIVGAGLSGLACAVELKKRGFEVEVYDKSQAVGGRVRTEVYEGFTLDRGFQVYLPSYEMGKYFFDYEKLKLKPFSAGARVFHEGRFQSLIDPIREPGGFLETVLSQLGSLKDKLLVLKLRSKSASVSKVTQNDQSTKDYLNEFGFSEKFISNFFKPFFSGIFLEKKLESSSAFFLYLFNKFSESEASVPEGGMQALPEQLKSNLGAGVVHLKSEVLAVSKEGVTFKDGTVKEYDFVVAATTPDVTNRLLGGSFDDRFNSSQTFYFKTKSKKFSSKKLFLNSNKEKLVNHIACMSAVSRTYAPEGWELFSVSVIGSESCNLEEVRSDLEKLFGPKEIKTWKHLKTYHVVHALPSKPVYSNTVIKKDGVYICGDFTSSPSIQGALSSGYQVAEEISKI